jgi:hypothetical protein
VPADVTAVVVNVTIANPTSGGEVIVHPATTLNATAGQVRTNAVGRDIAQLVTVPIDHSGQINLTPLLAADESHWV